MGNNSRRPWNLSTKRIQANQGSVKWDEFSAMVSSCTTVFRRKQKLSYVKRNIQEPPADDTKHTEQKSRKFSFIISQLLNQIESYFSNELWNRKTANEVHNIVHSSDISTPSGYCILQARDKNNKCKEIRIVSAYNSTLSSNMRIIRYLPIQ